MTDSRFHLGDILTVTTGIFMCPTRMDGLYRILNHLTGDNLMTHQLPRAAEECKPWLRHQFPTLPVTVPESAMVDGDTVMA